MSDVTKLLQEFRKDGVPSEALLDEIYEELRRIARSQFAGEKAGHTLQPTALVHEAYQRLFRSTDRKFANRRQFYAAAAETMRRILVDKSRRRLAKKRGGGANRYSLEEYDLVAPSTPEEIVDVHEALEQLDSTDAIAAELVKLRFFAGLTVKESADALGMSVRTANRTWQFARAWLHDAIHEPLSESS